MPDERQLATLGLGLLKRALARALTRAAQREVGRHVDSLWSLPVTHVRLIWAYDDDQRGTPPTISNQVGIGHLTCPMPATHIKTMDSDL